MKRILVISLLGIVLGSVACSSDKSNPISNSTPPKKEDLKNPPGPTTLPNGNAPTTSTPPPESAPRRPEETPLPSTKETKASSPSDNSCPDVRFADDMIFPNGDTQHIKGYTIDVPAGVTISLRNLTTVPSSQWKLRMTATCTDKSGEYNMPKAICSKQVQDFKFDSDGKVTLPAGQVSIAYMTSPNGTYPYSAYTGPSLSIELVDPNGDTADLAELVGAKYFPCNQKYSNFWANWSVVETPDLDIPVTISKTKKGIAQNLAEWIIAENKNVYKPNYSATGPKITGFVPMEHLYYDRSQLPWGTEANLNTRGFGNDQDNFGNLKIEWLDFKTKGGATLRIHHGFWLIRNEEGYPAQFDPLIPISIAIRDSKFFDVDLSKAFNARCPSSRIIPTPNGEPNYLCAPSELSQPGAKWTNPGIVLGNTWQD